jgi:hypothetical protein
LDAIGEALAHVEARGVRFYEAELHRMKGTLLLQQSAERHDRAAASLQ